MSPWKDPKLNPESINSLSPHGTPLRHNPKGKLMVDTSNLMNKRKRGTTPKTPPIFVSKTPTTPIPKRRRKLISELRQGITILKPIRPRPEYCFSPLTATTPTRPKSNLPRIKSPSRDARLKVLRAKLHDARGSDDVEDEISPEFFLDDLQEEGIKDYLVHDGEYSKGNQNGFLSSIDIEKSVEENGFEAINSPTIRSSPGSSSRQVCQRMSGTIRFDKDGSISPEVIKSFSSLSLTDDSMKSHDSNLKGGLRNAKINGNASASHMWRKESSNRNLNAEKRMSSSTSEIHPLEENLEERSPEFSPNESESRKCIEDTPTSPATTTSDWSEEMKEDYIDESNIQVPAFLDSPLIFVDKPRVNRRLFHVAR